MLDPMQPSRRYHRVGGQEYIPVGEFEKSLKLLQQADQDIGALATEYTKRCSAAVRLFHTSYKQSDVQSLKTVIPIENQPQTLSIQ